jgi:hypothetical protein
MLIEPMLTGVQRAAVGSRVLGHVAAELLLDYNYNLCLKYHSLPISDL